jgi:hypothetical protein
MLLCGLELALQMKTRHGCELGWRTCFRLPSGADNTMRKVGIHFDVKWLLSACKDLRSASYSSIQLLQQAHQNTSILFSMKYRQTDRHLLAAADLRNCRTARTVGLSGTWLHSDSSEPCTKCHKLWHWNGWLRKVKISNIEIHELRDSTVLVFTRRQFTQCKVITLKVNHEVHKRMFGTVTAGC